MSMNQLENCMQTSMDLLSIGCVMYRENITSALGWKVGSFTILNYHNLVKLELYYDFIFIFLAFCVGYSRFNLLIAC